MTPRWSSFIVPIANYSRSATLLEVLFSYSRFLWRPLEYPQFLAGLLCFSQLSVEEFNPTVGFGYKRNKPGPPMRTKEGLMLGRISYQDE
jgi:hypothetical protein